MAQLSDILSREKKRTERTHFREVLLYPEGSFYRAYEWSAWLACRFICQFKATKRLVKSIGEDMVFVGFPQTSLQKYIPEGAELISIDPTHVKLVLPENVWKEDSTIDDIQTEFGNWKNAVPYKEGKETKVNTLLQSESLSEVLGNGMKLPGENPPKNLTEIMQRVLSFPVEKKSPIDCMLFLAEIKMQIASLI